MLTSRREAESPGQVPYLEAQDDGPDKAEGQPVVPIHDVVGPHVLKMDSLLLQELKGLVHVLQTVDAHSSLGGFRLKQMSRRWKRIIQEGRNQLRTTAQEVHMCPFMQRFPTHTKTLKKRAHSVQGQSLSNSLRKVYLRDGNRSLFRGFCLITEVTQFTKEHRSWKLREKGTQFS